VQISISWADISLFASCAESSPSAQVVFDQRTKLGSPSISNFRHSITLKPMRILQNETE